MDLRMVVGKVLYLANKHLPEILIGAGTVGTVAGTVLACKATVKASKIVEESKTQLEQTEDPETIKELTRNEIMEVGKNYILPVGVELISIASILAGTGVFKKRIVGLATAYSVVSTGFAKYRLRVKNKLGDEEEKKLYLGIEEEEVVEKFTDEDGKTHKVKKKVLKNVDPALDYAILIDEDHPLWNPDAEKVIFDLKNIEKYLNDQLLAYGWLSYNAVCRELYSLDHVCPDGQLLVWIYDKDNPTGDNYISLGISDEEYAAFKEGKQSYLVVDLNFDGPYYKQIPKEQ